ncbi:MAG: hypothetical protein V7668_00695 [Cereibacter changlensis]|uniref:HPt domain-containing protein n=2 Tax=Cereibacter changlensis TaxID=402884 RepID=A0A2T4JYL7_9RHOB|nr:hypothetical protein [Cereibacter changlensis]PTE22853.1 hypothetical protein C5F48_05195 [Cereibacter changlensis JA139]PZX58789.1 hypothetical protein LX76_00294 [Cereibacter changlensis]TKA97837.1 hypothetical protein FAZ78_03810 [Cereibacter changlensis]
MDCSITALQPKERVCQDAEQIAAICREMGAPAAEQAIGRALGELTLILSGLAARVQAQDVADLGRQLRRLQRMSEHLGMVSLGHVACDARRCAETGDGTAFAAVWARLIRVAEQSLAGDRPPLDQRV